jgi:hypothetical protein
MHTEFDEQTQEEFSADSVNLRCVLSGRIRHECDGGTPELAINLYNSFHFDSNLFRREEKVVQAIAALRKNRISHCLLFWARMFAIVLSSNGRPKQRRLLHQTGSPCRFRERAEIGHVEAECRRYLRRFRNVHEIIAGAENTSTLNWVRPRFFPAIFELKFVGPWHPLIATAVNMLLAAARSTVGRPR